MGLNAHPEQTTRTQEKQGLQVSPWPKTTTLVESGHRNRLTDSLSGMPSAARLPENNAVNEIAAGDRTLALALHLFNRTLVPICATPCTGRQSDLDMGAPTLKWRYGL